MIDALGVQVNFSHIFMSLGAKCGAKLQKKSETTKSFHFFVLIMI